MSKEPKASIKNPREKVPYPEVNFSFELPNSTSEAIHEFKRLPQGTILVKSGQKFPSDLQILRGYISLSPLSRMAEVFTIRDTNQHEIVYEHSSIPFESIQRIVWQRTFMEISK